MGFVAAIRTVLSKYADFTGRAGRPEFWWFMLFVVILVVATGILDGTFSSPDDSIGWLTLIVSIALFLPFIAVHVRRLHDRDMTGWWYLLNLVPVGGTIVLILCALRGTPGDNRFGPPPEP